jgi:DNA recombination protein RmuC
VKAAAERLAQLQEATMTETKRLTTLLGRSQERGRWGESQLYRILELSGLLPHVDFDTQATITTSTSTRRPDAVVRLPQGMSVAIDAKAPYEAYDAAGAATSDAERERLMKEYGKALRNHITDLGKKAYWDGLGLSPQFVVCFVPSDHLLAAAFASDPTLLEAGLASRVLVAGPTTLMGMLWSVALGWQQFSLQANMEEVLKLAQRLMDRAGTAYGHLDKLGRAINGLATTYGQVVGSLENSLFVTVRAMGALALPATTTDDLAPSELTTVTTRALDPERWPTPAATELPEGPAN